MTITLTREEAQQVLNAFLGIGQRTYDAMSGDAFHECSIAVSRLRARLAQPEPEPVAWMRKNEDCADCITWHRTEENTIPLYTAPSQREWQGLTHEEIAEESGAAKAQNHMVLTLAEGFFCGARWAESKLKEKNFG